MSRVRDGLVIAVTLLGFAALVWFTILPASAR